MPKHRFTDYSKAQLNAEIWRQISEVGPANKSPARGIRTPVKLGYGVNLAIVQHHKKLRVLNPSRSQVSKDSKSKSFVKEKRPELFPVKDEHKNPCSYLGSGQSFLKKRNVSKLFRAVDHANATIGQIQMTFTLFGVLI